MFQSKNSKGSKIEVLADALINNKSSKNDLPRDRRMEVDGDMQRTKADILGYNDDDDDDAKEEEEETHHRDKDYIDASSNGSEDDSSSENNQSSSTDFDNEVKILPSTLEGLTERFNELLREYNLDKKYEHRNELVFLLDEMLRQNGISREDYEKLNNKIDAIASREEKEIEEESIEKSTVKRIIQHDVKELKNFLKGFKEESEEESIDTLLKIEELVDLFDEESFIENKSVVDQLFHQLDKLEESNLLKSKLLRFRMLLKNIERNRFRVKEILNRFKHGADDWHTLSMLQREELLSREQAGKINEILKNGKDLEKIADIIESTKIGDIKSIQFD